MEPVHIHDYTAGKIMTISGIEFDLVNPTPDMICIDDIAFALGLINRFGGHTCQPYNVAQHSILVAHIAAESDASLFLPALMHDAPEAYIGDVVKPLKHILGFAYADLESNIERVIDVKFRIGFSVAPVKEAIKKADMQALEMEDKSLRYPKSNDLLTAFSRYGLHDVYYRNRLSCWHFLEFFTGRRTPRLAQ